MIEYASTGLLIFGFTFFYGGMTVKLWGVYKLFSQQRTLDDNTSIRTITIMIECESTYKNYFLIATLCYKGIVLLLGGFIVWPALYMSMKKGFSHFSGFTLAVFMSILSSIVMAIISFLIPTEPNALFAITGCLILFTTILTTLLIYISKIIVIAKGGDPLSMKFFSPIGAAFGFLDNVAGEGQMPELGADNSVNMPEVALTAEKTELSDNKSVLHDADHNHDKIGLANLGGLK
ncbi:unnamed protein product [Owenia fusiformis]|uniref:Uncharacterized protein n=1 Tax=Owenia fusiformis TaxID=6347 RepID=A0A8J1URV2_OWEFU|nr:unnamed protein product [Owenia fusiformis]